MTQYFLTTTELIRADLVDAPRQTGAPRGLPPSENALRARFPGKAKANNGCTLPERESAPVNREADAETVATLTLSEKRSGAATVIMSVRWDSVAPPVEAFEASIAVNEDQVASLARDIPLWLLEKVKCDYGLPSLELPALVELYKFQAAIYAIGLELAKGRQLFSGELATHLGVDTVPFVALALMQEGVPYMRWWEEQAENFIDLWFSPFRLFARPEVEAEARRIGAEECRAPPAEAAPASREELAAKVAQLERQMEAIMAFLKMRQ